MMGTPEAPEARRTRNAAPRPVVERIGELAGEAVAAGRRALETETGQKIAAAADSAFDKAGQLGCEAEATARKIWTAETGRNLAVGAGAGFVLGLVFPAIGPVVGGLSGAGLGSLRTLFRKG